MELEILKRLAMTAGSREEIHFSVQNLASCLGISRQAMERELCLLEDQGYIVRNPDGGGETVRITELGNRQLAARQGQNPCLPVGQRLLRGKVVSGMGKGRYFVSQEGYARQFEASLGFCPYPGTLNVKLDEPFAPFRQRATRITGFSSEGCAFGECRCYRIRINGVQAAIVRPEMSSYPPDLVEIIAAVNLRERLQLRDGDRVELELQ